MSSARSAPLDREVLAALEELVRAKDDPRELLGILGARFAAEAGEARLQVAREAAAAAARARDPKLELSWLRKLHALQPLAQDGRVRWLALEREVGGPAGRLEAVRALADLASDSVEQAELAAAEGELLAELGQLNEASACYARALASQPRPKLAWLRAQSDLLARLGRPSERVDLLRALARHPEASVEERTRHQRERIELLASHPELREEAALELRMWLDSDPGASRSAQLERMRSLLQLYASLGRDADWCALAERALPLSPETERAELERRIAARLGNALGSTDQAIAAWQRVLTRTPADREALTALASLLQRPGDEARRADALERLAATEPEASEKLWLEAARLRWQSLGDARAALDDVDRSLALDARLEGAHDLRSELCAHLDRHDDEATSLRALLRPSPKAASPRIAGCGSLSSRLRSARAGPRRSTPPSARSPLARGQITMLREARRVFERAHAFERARDLLCDEIAAASGDDALALHRRLARIAWDELHDEELACKSLAALASSDALRTDDRERYAAALAEQGRFRESLEQRSAALRDVGDLATPAAWLELARDSLAKLDDAARARDACDRALAAEPGQREALELRALLHNRLCEPAREFEDVLALAELEGDPARAADRFTRAGAIARDRLDDPMRAWALFRTALRHDGAHLPALLGAGEIALARHEWPEAERAFGLATSLLRGSPDEEKLAAVARSAAQAAQAQERFAEAFRYLELALEREPEHPAALDSMAGLALRLGAHARARDCLDTRLRALELSPDERADRLVKLAQACEGLQQLDRAAAALEEVLAIRPNDEVSRARAVDLLERLGETERAVLQLDAWSEHVPAEFAARLRLRAAQLELAHGDRARARAATRGDHRRRVGSRRRVGRAARDHPQRRRRDARARLRGARAGGREGGEAARLVALERGRGVGVGRAEWPGRAPRDGGADLRTRPRGGGADACREPRPARGLGHGGEAAREDARHGASRSPGGGGAVGGGRPRVRGPARGHRARAALLPASARVQPAAPERTRGARGYDRVRPRGAPRVRRRAPRPAGATPRTAQLVALARANRRALEARARAEDLRRGAPGARSRGDRHGRRRAAARRDRRALGRNGRGGHRASARDLRGRRAARPGRRTALRLCWHPRSSRPSPRSSGKLGSSAMRHCAESGVSRARTLRRPATTSAGARSAA